MLLLYTEEQLYKAYKVYIRDITNDTDEIPNIDVFRDMFETSEQVQQLADREFNEH